MKKATLSARKKIKRNKKDSYELLVKLCKKYMVVLERSEEPESAYDYCVLAMFEKIRARMCKWRSIAIGWSSPDDILPVFCMKLWHPIVGEMLGTFYPKKKGRYRRVKL
jgi:hypothetical protein